MEQLQRIKVSDYSVTFYGGTLNQKFRTVITLYNESYGVLGWIKFHDEGSEIPQDTFESTGLHMNAPLSLYEPMLSTLKSSRPVYLAYFKETGTGMLMEFRDEMPPPLRPVGMN